MAALAAGWNALVLDLRERDLLNNRELAALTFEQLQLTHSQKCNFRNLPHVGDLGLTSVLPARSAKQPESSGTVTCCVLPRAACLQLPLVRQETLSSYECLG